MKRFSEDELADIISDCTIVIGKKPTIEELAIYINNNIDRSLSPESYNMFIVSKKKVSDYVSLYNLKDMIEYIRKPKRQVSQ